jgi:hypothetical protein
MYLLNGFFNGPGRSPDVAKGMLKAQEKGEADFADLLVKLKKGTGF